MYSNKLKLKKIHDNNSSGCILQTHKKMYCGNVSSLGCEFNLKLKLGSSHHGSAETNPSRNPEVLGLIPGLAQQVKDLALP